jgi:Domain of unknown function (DUF1844)
MPDKNAEDAGFKVVDRRPFASDGTTREEEREVPKESPKAERPADRPAAAAAPPPKSPRVEAPRVEVARIEVPDAGFDDALSLDADSAAEASGFDTLVSYLGTTAMFQLGLMAGPSGERIPAQLAHARQTIDMLEALVDKTQGNLSADEARLLDDVLYELRIAFVEVEKRSPK